MIAVIFKVWPARGRKDDYLEIAAVRTEHRTGQAFCKWLECQYWFTDSPKATSR
jgi:hypothetical protein